MKHVFANVVAFAAMSAFASTPSVEVTGVAQDAVSGLVTVTYTLANAPAIVTAEILSAGEMLPSGTMGAMLGDVHKLVSESGTHRFTWRPDRDTASLLSASDLTFKVDAWTADAPPDYMVVGLAETGLTYYYSTTNAFPGGLLANPAYRTDMLVLRYIEAKGKTFKMGAWDTVNDRSLENGAQSREPQYDATLTNDFWIGVFEITQAQGEIINGTSSGSNWKSFFSNVLYRAMRPMEMVSHNAARDKNTAANFYPRAPHSSSYIGKLRTMTGLAFDLPHDAQWEYACRAGNGVGYWGNGEAMLPAGTASYDSYDINSAANVPSRWALNGGMATYPRQDLATSWDNLGDVEPGRGVAICGSYPPNSWGLYDMHGNVFELVADFSPSSASTWSGLAGRPNISFDDPTKQANGDDPTHPSWTSVANRGFRGGAYQRGASQARSAYRNSQVASGEYNSVGFRVVINIEP